MFDVKLNCGCVKFKPFNKRNMDLSVNNNMNNVCQILCAKIVKNCPIHLITNQKFHKLLNLRNFSTSHIDTKEYFIFNYI